MANIKVEVVQIEDILNHPNADRLEIAVVKDWHCVVQRGEFKKGDLGIYFPIDSILPENLEAKIFGADSKIKLTKHRIKTIKLRGTISQGLLVEPSKLGLSTVSIGEDLTSFFGVTKYEPPPPPFYSNLGQAKKTEQNPNFHKYHDILNAKNYKEVFTENDDVVVTEKIHGTNARFGWLPYRADKWYKKIWHKLGFAPKWEFVVGSRNLQVKGDNVYTRIAEKYDLKNKLSDIKGFILYGEIYGPGIQRGYHYGLQNNNIGFVAFDLKEYSDNTYLNAEDLEIWCGLYDIPSVPILYHGVFIKDLILKLRGGPSDLCLEQKIKEGVVVKSKVEDNRSYIGRKILKFINDEYLLQDNTEYH